MSYKKEVLACVLGAAACVHGHAADSVEEAGSVREALSQGTTSFDLRVRYEHVDQDGATDLTGDALTARGILGYKTQSYNHWSVGLIFEFIAPITDDSEYNDTINGESGNAVIADPKTVGIDEAYVLYDGIEKATFKIGRQVVNLDNQRFIGAVGWRQNRQTFDALRGSYKANDALTLNYLFVYDVQRIFSDSHPTKGTEPMSSHLFNAAYKIEDIGTVVGYGYFLDFNKAGDDGSGKDSATIGARFSGKRGLSDDMKLTYEVEFAQQSDYADRANDLSASYTHLRVGVDYEKLSASVGYELLGSDDGNDAFSTPLATLHKFNGWADKFLGTGTNGLQDLYLSLGASFESLPGLKTKLVYHQFDEDEGSLSANEIDIVATYKFQDIEGVTAGAKAALYSEDGLNTDTTKFWLWTGYRF